MRPGTLYETFCAPPELRSFVPQASTSPAMAVTQRMLFMGFMPILHRVCVLSILTLGRRQQHNLARPKVRDLGDIGGLETGTYSFPRDARRCAIPGRSLFERKPVD